MTIIIYLIGYIIAYYLVRYITIKSESYPSPRTWSDIGKTLVIALLSWVTIIIILFIYIIFLINTIKPNIKIKPPKWL